MIVTLGKQKSDPAHIWMEAEIFQRSQRGLWALTSKQERFAINSQCFPGLILSAFTHEFIDVV